MEFHGNNSEDSSLRGAYHLIRRVGSGTQGQAFLVRERMPNAGSTTEESAGRNLAFSGGQKQRYANERRDWVIKVVDLPSDPKECAARISEASTMLSLSHPCIVGCKESAIQDGSKLCIVMEFCREGDLRARIRQQQSAGLFFPESQILDWLLQLALALEYLHRRKILHRDVKSENVFLRSKSDFPPGNAATVQLGDFGTARSLDTTQALAKTMVGTPVYMSPEILQGQAYNHKSDMWSLGCILYEMMCFKHPFQGSNLTELTYHVLFSAYDPPPQMYSSELRQLLSSLLAEDAGVRPTASAILSLPILRSRASRFLTCCQHASTRCLGDIGPLADPIYKRCLDIYRTATEQARQTGLHLTFPSDKAASAASHASGQTVTSTQCTTVSPAQNDLLPGSPRTPKAPRRMHADAAGFGPPLPQSTEGLTKPHPSDVHSSSPRPSRMGKPHPDTHSHSHKQEVKENSESTYRVCGSQSPKIGIPCERGPCSNKWEAHPLPSPPPLGTPSAGRRRTRRLAVEVSGKVNLEVCTAQISPSVRTLRSSSSYSDLFRLDSEKNQSSVKLKRQLSSEMGLPSVPRSEGRWPWEFKEKQKAIGHRATKSMDFDLSAPDMQKQSGVPPPLPKPKSETEASSPVCKHRVSIKGMPPKSPTNHHPCNLNASSTSPKFPPSFPPSPHYYPQDTSQKDDLFSGGTRREASRQQVPSPIYPTPPKTPSPASTSPKAGMHLSIDMSAVRESRRRRWSCPGGTDSNDGVREVIKEVVLEDLAHALETATKGGHSNNGWDFVKSRLADPGRQCGGRLPEDRVSSPLHLPFSLDFLSTKAKPCSPSCIPYVE